MILVKDKKVINIADWSLVMKWFWTGRVLGGG